MRSLLRSRLDPTEFTHALAARLTALLPAPLQVPGPLRIALRYTDVPYTLNISDAYAAYQRDAAEPDALLDAVADAIRDRLSHLTDPTSWDEAKRTVRPWLLSPDDADTLLYPTRGQVGALAVAYRFIRPVLGTAAYITPAAWGVPLDTVHARALANLRADCGAVVSFLPAAPQSAALRLAPRDRDAASRLLLPEVRAAILARVGSPAAVLPAARDAVFVTPADPFGEPPATFTTLPAARAALTGPDALTATPFVIEDDALVRR